MAVVVVAADAFGTAVAETAGRETAMRGEETVAFGGAASTMTVRDGGAEGISLAVTAGAETSAAAGGVVTDARPTGVGCSFTPDVIANATPPTAIAPAARTTAKRTPRFRGGGVTSGATAGDFVTPAPVVAVSTRSPLDEASA